MKKAPDAFRTISEVAEDLDLPQHVLRFWETRFSQIKPMKRGGGRRYYRPDDISLLRGIRHLLYGEGYTIKGVQRILKEQGVRFVTEGALNPDDEISPPVVPTKASEPIDQQKNETAIEKNVARVDDKPVAKPAVDPLAASYESPESLKPAKPDVKPNKDVAPFTLTHNVPAHLVDAITSGESMVETVAMPEAVTKTDEEWPFDILPESAVEEESGKGRSLLKRFKTVGAAAPLKDEEAGAVMRHDDVHKLQETLVDLLECKRLLDQIR